MCPLTRFRVSRPCAQGSSPCVSAVRDGWTSGRALVTLQSEEDYTLLTRPPESTATWFHISPGGNGLPETRTAPKAPAGVLRRDLRGYAGGSPQMRPSGGCGRESSNTTPGRTRAGGPLMRPPEGRRQESSDATPRGTQAGGPPTRLPDRRVGRRQESSDTTPGWTQKQGAPTPGRHWESEWHSLPPGASPVKKAVSHPRKRKRRRAHESTADAAARSTGRLARCEAQYQGHFSSSQTAQVSKGSKFQDSETLVFTMYNVQMLTSNFVLFTYIHTSIPGKTMVTHKIN